MSRVGGTILVLLGGAAIAALSQGIMVLVIMVIVVWVVLSAFKLV